MPQGAEGLGQHLLVSNVTRPQVEEAQAVALAWLLQRSPNVLLIPGTSSVAHLHENIAGAALKLSEADLAELEHL